MSKIYTVILGNDDGDEITRVTVKFVSTIDRGTEGWTRFLDENENERASFPTARIIGVVG